jgi:two-component system response regulator VanR
MILWVFVKEGVEQTMTANILVVDDEQSIADLIEVYLKNENYDVFKFYNGRDALQCVENQNMISLQ